MFSSTEMPKVQKQPPDVFGKKKLLLDILQYSQGNTWIGVFFNKVAVL